MRKLFIAASGLFLSSVFLAPASFSQDLAYNPFPKAVMESLMANDNVPERSLNTISIDANQKLQKSFNRNFKNAGKVEWYNLKKNYLAVFDYEGRKTRALFTKNGFTIYSIAFGDEKDLPKNYRQMLKGMYVDYEIMNAVEIHSSIVTHTTWLALLQSEDNIVIARIADGGLDEYARYNSKPKEVKKLRKGRVIIHKTRNDS